MTWIKRRVRVALSGFPLSAPWELKPYDLSKMKIGAVGREAGPQAFMKWSRSVPALDLFVFSDGSMNQIGFSAGRYAIFRDTNLLTTGSIPLGSSAEVYDDEIIAAVTGVQVAVTIPEASLAENIHVCLDNEAAAIALEEEYKNSTNFEYITKFSSLRKSWHNRPRGTFWPRKIGSINIRWCPGHMGIEGNVKADTIAKESCLLVPESDPLDTTKRAKRKIAERFENARINYFEVNAPHSYKRLGLNARDKTPFSLQLPREVLGYLLAARSGHGDFSHYHIRFKHDDAELNCICGSAKSPVHFYYCRKARQLEPLRVPGRQGRQAVD